LLESPLPALQFATAAVATIVNEKVGAIWAATIDSASRHGGVLAVIQRSFASTAR
jgi:hypothetical protein